MSVAAFQQQFSAGGAALFAPQFVDESGPGPDPTFTIQPASIASAAAIGSPTFAFVSAFDVSPAGVASTAAIGVPVVDFDFEPIVSLITLAQAKQYLDFALSVTMPDFVVQAAIDKTSPYLPDLVTAGYSTTDQLMIQCMAVALIAVGGTPRRLTSQHAPSGASRGFKVSDRDLQALRRALAALDVAGILAAVVGPDPTANTLFMVTC